MLLIAEEHVEVLVTDPGRRDEMLDYAEALLRQKPQQLAGILVTRHGPGHYTLVLSNVVPFGETHEQSLS
ncbi:hypothetical protein [Paenarthrobacter nicotinovorans]|uniref:hypothetical protein n=1 Tax=Paenarthrobacter nicotinovorans TaxID=29320 RepID=UPI003A80F07C